MYHFVLLNRTKEVQIGKKTKIKNISEKFLVMSDSVTEAEIKMKNYSEVNDEYKEISIKGVVRANVDEVIPTENWEGEWWMARLVYENDEGKATVMVMVEADDIFKASAKVKETYSSSVSTVEFTSLTSTKILIDDYLAIEH